MWTHCSPVAHRMAAHAWLNLSCHPAVQLLSFGDSPSLLLCPWTRSLLFLVQLDELECWWSGGCVVVCLCSLSVRSDLVGAPRLRLGDVVVFDVSRLLVFSCFLFVCVKEICGVMLRCSRFNHLIDASKNNRVGSQSEATMRSDGSGALAGSTVAASQRLRCATRFCE